MHLGYQGTGSIEHLELLVFGLLFDHLRDSMSAEDHDRVSALGIGGRDFLEFIHKYGASVAQGIHNIFVMHNFMTDIHRRTEHIQCTLNDFDGTIHTGAESTGIGHSNTGAYW